MEEKASPGSGTSVSKAGVWCACVTSLWSMGETGESRVWNMAQRFVKQPERFSFNGQEKPIDGFK